MIDVVTRLDDLIDMAVGTKSPTATRCEHAGLVVEHVGRVLTVVASEGQSQETRNAGRITVGTGDADGGPLDALAVRVLDLGEDDRAVIAQAVEDALAEAQGQAWSARLADSHAALCEAENVVAGLRVERDQVIRGAVGAGWSMYRVAQMLGLSQQAVRKIVNWQ